MTRKPNKKGTCVVCYDDFHLTREPHPDFGERVVMGHMTTIIGNTYYGTKDRRERCTGSFLPPRDFGVRGW